VPVEQVEVRAVADFDAHVVEVQPRGAVVAVDSVRRGPVAVGERIELVDQHPGTSVSQVFAVAERYRVLPTTRTRPYAITICNLQLLPGRAAIASSAESNGIGAMVAAGAALTSIIGLGVLGLRRRRRSVPL
jgi:hypothetical protein